MCLGCAEAILMNSEGKTPDTTETVLYLAGFAVWMMILAHLRQEKSLSEDDQAQAISKGKASVIS